MGEGGWRFRPLCDVRLINSRTALYFNPPDWGTVFSKLRAARDTPRDIESSIEQHINGLVFEQLEQEGHRFWVFRGRSALIDDNPEFARWVQGEGARIIAVIEGPHGFAHRRRLAGSCLKMRLDTARLGRA
ncbi:hypothetical protein GCM10010488_38800 [Oerskovia jenensis]